LDSVRGEAEYLKEPVFVLWKQENGLVDLIKSLQFVWNEIVLIKARYKTTWHLAL